MIATVNEETTPSLVRRLQESDQDHEFYPTTEEIIKKLVSDIKCRKDNYEYHHRVKSSFLDIGAGNGKVLRAVRDLADIHELFAIEKSTILCQQLDPSILIVGTDFEQQTLFSKQVGFVFSNPPYSQFEQWADKIIRQSACTHVYLVIPQRWEQSTVIQDAIKWRNVKVTKLGSFDFEDSEDRQARAKVHLIRFDLPDGDDAFDRFFEHEFAGLYDKFKEADKTPDEDQQPAEEAEKFSQLVPGPNYPEALVAMYDAEMAKVRKNYQLVSELDADLLKEFDMCPKRIMGCLKARLKGMKNTYWNELFTRLDKVTSRLTSKSRNTLLDTLQKHVEVDFTYNNILAVVIWVINNANQYLESQLIETYEVMVSKCNVQMYKSNKRTWQEDHWRYNSGDGTRGNSHFALDYRIVTHRVGGFHVGYSEYSTGLGEEACTFLGDLLTIANNLGFTTAPGERHQLSGRNGNGWSAGELRTFNMNDHRTPIFDVRAFKNRNLHLRLNQDFICALNVEHGRLKGWINSPQEAAEELQDPNAAIYFQTNHRLELNPKLLLTC